MLFYKSSFMKTGMAFNYLPGFYIEMNAFHLTKVYALLRRNISVLNSWH